MIALVRSELSKQWRRPRTYVVLGGAVLVPILAAIALKLNAPTLGERDDSFSYLATLTGLMMPVAALRFMSRFLLVVVVAVIAGDAVASEARWGNLGSMLALPVGRGRLLAAKAASGAVLAAAVVALVGIAGLGAGAAFFDWQSLDLVPFRQTTGQLLGNLALGSAYVLWSMATVAAFAFMVSTMTDSPIGAMLAGVGLQVGAMVLDGINSLGSVRGVLHTHFVDAWTSLFIDPSRGPTAEMLRGALLQVPYVLVFGGIAWRHFRYKDIRS